MGRLLVPLAELIPTYKGDAYPLLRDLKRTQHYHKPEGDWPAFRKPLKRLIWDALRLSKWRRELPAERFESRRRLDALLARP